MARSLPVNAPTFPAVGNSPKAASNLANPQNKPSPEKQTKKLASPHPNTALSHRPGPTITCFPPATPKKVSSAKLKFIFTLNSPHPTRHSTSAHPPVLSSAPRNGCTPTTSPSTRFTPSNAISTNPFSPNSSPIHNPPQHGVPIHLAQPKILPIMTKEIQ